MGPFLDSSDLDFGPLTMDMIVSEMPAYPTDVEEILAEQRGCREVNWLNIPCKFKMILRFHSLGWTKVVEEFVLKMKQKCVLWANYGLLYLFFFLASHICHSFPFSPLRHIIKDKQVVCKHWLRGLCKKGDQCEFLHEYDLSRMPECFFFSKYRIFQVNYFVMPSIPIYLVACSNKECPFRHIDPESKIKDCPWYDRGKCSRGKIIFKFRNFILFYSTKCFKVHIAKIVTDVASIALFFFLDFAPMGQNGMGK